jgi:ABC-type uncharacterized transport system permease subunit
VILLEMLGTLSFWVAVLRVATPLIFGTLGVLLCERAGVLNLGIEGLMVAGAFAGWFAVYLGAPLWGGVLAAALVGAIFGALHALLTVVLALSQHVAGLGMTMLATALSYFAYRVAFPKVNTPPTIQPFATMDWLPLPVLKQQTPLTLLALLLVPSIGWALYRTPAGLALRMAGESPAAVESQGISVTRVRTSAIMLGSPPFVDAALPHGRDAQLRPAARQRSGTLLEGIALWGELKPLLTQEALVERALPIATGRWPRAAGDPQPCRRLRRPRCWRSRRCWR